MQREIVNLTVDVPQFVTLDYSEGKEVTTKRGSTQWQYTLDDDARIMWLPLAGKQAIERSGARAGDQIRILKTFLGKETVFTAQVVQPELKPQLAPANGHANGQGKIPPRAYYQPESRPAPGAPLSSTQAEPARAEVALTTPAASHTDALEQHLKHFLVIAGRATEDARRILIEEGYPAPEYFWDDIRTMANTLFINANGGRK